MIQNYPASNPRIVKNKSATASLVLSIISISLLVLMIPIFFVGGLLMSMAGQSPEASGVDRYDIEAMEEYVRDSRALGTAGIIVAFSPPIISGITGILGLIFGIIGLGKPAKRAQAIAGIVMSGIPICIGIIIIYAGIL